MLWEASGFFVEVVLLVVLKSLASAEGLRSLCGGKGVSSRRGGSPSAERKVFVSSGWGSLAAALWGEKILFLTFVRRDLAVRAFFYIFAPKCMHYEQY